MNELQEMYGKKYGDAKPEGKKHCRLQIFGFPCNQFGYQEPAENFELMNTLKYVRPGYGFVPAFPLSGKLFVNGNDESQIFTYLKARCPVPMGMIANRSDITWQPIRNNDISWNFSKWLLRSNGHPYKRYTSRTTPEAVENDIKMLLEECENGNSTIVGNNQAPIQNQAPAPQTQILGSNTLILTNAAKKQKRSINTHPPHDSLFY